MLCSVSDRTGNQLLQCWHPAVRTQYRIRLFLRLFLRLLYSISTSIPKRSSNGTSSLWVIHLDTECICHSGQAHFDKFIDYYFDLSWVVYLHGIWHLLWCHVAFQQSEIPLMHSICHLVSLSLQPIDFWYFIAGFSRIRKVLAQTCSVFRANISLPVCFQSHGFYRLLFNLPEVSIASTTLPCVNSNRICPFAEPVAVPFQIFLVFLRHMFRHSGILATPSWKSLLWEAIRLWL